MYLSTLDRVHVAIGKVRPDMMSFHRWWLWKRLVTSLLCPKGNQRIDTELCLHYAWLYHLWIYICNEQVYNLARYLLFNIGKNFERMKKRKLESIRDKVHKVGIKKLNGHKTHAENILKNSMHWPHNIMFPCQQILYSNFYL